MAKRYRRKNTASSKKQKIEKRPFPWKKALILLGLVIVFFSFYQIAMYFFWSWVLHAYCIAAGILALIYLLWNRCIFTIPAPSDLPDSWSDTEKNAFIKDQAKRKKQSAILLYILIPLIATIVFDMVYLFLEINMGIKLS